MKKRFFAALVAVALVSTASVFAAGVGLQGGAGVSAASGGYSPDVAVTFKLDSLPAVFAADVDVNGGRLNAVGLTADYWVQNPRLAGMFHYYWAPGFAAGVKLTDPLGMYLGFRAVAGINIFPVDFLEVYVQAAWQPTIYLGGPNGFDYSLDLIPVNGGFRFWF